MGITSECDKVVNALSKLICETAKLCEQNENYKYRIELSNATANLSFALAEIVKTYKP